MITLERLRELLHYDPLTGLFTWLVSRGSVRAGSIAGSPSPKGYLRVQLDGKFYYCQRLAWFYMKGVWPTHEIDHEDTERANNIWLNLREATHAKNLCNRTRYRNNTSGFKGVSWNKKRERWEARIASGCRQIYLGVHDTAELAHAAYVRAAEERHGEFARAV